MKTRLHSYVSLLAFVAGAALLAEVLRRPAFAVASAPNIRILFGGLLVGWLATLPRLGAARLSNRAYWISLLPLLPALVWAMIGDSTSMPVHALDPADILQDLAKYNLALERFRRAQALGFSLDLLGAGACGLLWAWMIHREGSVVPTMGDAEG